jgi:hypothetical protein
VLFRSGILKKLLENEKFTNSIPLSPVKAEGWEMLFQVDPAIVPSTLLVGVNGETLFLGVLDPKGLDKKPAFSPEIQELLAKDSFGTFFFDAPALWDYLKLALLAKNSVFKNEVDSVPSARDILDSDIPLGLVGAWTPSVETAFLEIRTLDVAPEKHVLPKLVNAWKSFLLSDGGDENDGDDESAVPFDLDRSQPLTLLLVVKMAVEEALAEGSGSLDELREDFSGFAVILETAGGDIYVGTQVTGEEKASLRAQVEPFGLLGSAALTAAPDGSPYDGQEVVWLKIDRGPRTLDDREWRF